ncbi:MAG TPA: tyrosine-type recombinase/integrase [Smithella sp.]|nr:tyrosine-type recombinase/integrase [Smithella sp.]HQH15543.1 tyrosine-type recombinase/integrase [Smithella sp.]
MTKGQNSNRPQKGSKITVDPIRRMKDIQSISKMLSDNPRNNLLFVMGTNNGLRTGDLLKLKVGDVNGMKIGDTLPIKEGKTGKNNFLVMNKSIYRSLQVYLEKINTNDEDFLFASRKGKRSITIQCVNNMVKKWASEINLKGNYGAHSLRKTWGYIQRTTYGVGFEILCKRFNHSSPAITMRYLGIEDKEVQNILMNEVG